MVSPKNLSEIILIKQIIFPILNITILHFLEIFQKHYKVAAGQAKQFRKDSLKYFRERMVEVAVYRCS